MTAGAGELEDRVVLVTGAGAGVGGALAPAAAARGARLVLCDRAGGRLDEAVVRAERAAGPGRVLAVAADVSREADVEELFERALDAFGRVDAAVNAASVDRGGPLIDARVEDFDEVLATNVTGAFLVSVRAIQEFLAQGGGRIVTIAAAASASGAILAASQGALHGLTRTIAKEYGGRGVLANLVTHEGGAGRGCAGAAGAALFLAGDRASFVNGATIHVGRHPHPGPSAAAAAAPPPPLPSDRGHG